MFASNGLATAAPIITSPVGTDYLLITKKLYPATTSNVVASYNPLLGGGTVTVTGHAGINSGPYLLFNDSLTPSWSRSSSVSLTYFVRFVFPKPTYVSKILVIPASSTTSYFVDQIDVYADGGLLGSYTPTTISSADGLVVAYSGKGYRIDYTNVKCTTLEMIFPYGPTKGVYIGEIELRGGLIQ